MVAKVGGLGKEFNRRAALLSPGRFFDYLKWKAELNGKIVIDQNEAYTSKTCFECGLLSDPGASETYKCNHCDNVCGRDVHACFNILTKYMSSYSSHDDKNNY